MKEYLFDVPCYYVYSVKAKTEKQAREILIKDGGLELMGDLSLDEQNYKMATLNEIREIEWKEKHGQKMKQNLQDNY